MILIAFFVLRVNIWVPLTQTAMIFATHALIQIDYFLISNILCRKIQIDQYFFNHLFMTRPGHVSLGACDVFCDNIAPEKREMTAQNRINKRRYHENPRVESDKEPTNGQRSQWVFVCVCVCNTLRMCVVTCVRVRKRERAGNKWSPFNLHRATLTSPPPYYLCWPNNTLTVGTR